MIIRVRVLSAVASVALAMGGVALTAPAAHANELACLRVLEASGESGDASEGLIICGATGEGSFTQEECVQEMQGNGFSEAVAQKACTAAKENRR
ncbi:MULTISPECIES: hypothetical protein [unclassified Streptomyces]|uniref:hypothetical protein n=1 Tax=unclassified Streptomyces TaxID=2593676 RepID=UPI002E2F68B9|nr:MULTISPECIES: hypothetical protein [unclassified Streptomyces]WUC62911.1 hypothetical protein OG861_01125 [Streptomyces sp. NBC_00539]